MTWFAEDPLPVWLIGALLFTFALIAYLQLRTTWTLVAMAAVVVLVGALTLVEMAWLTPREQVEQTLTDVLAAVEANDLPTTLSFLASSAVDTRSDAETLMPRLEISRARVLDTPKIEVHEDEAEVVFRAFFKAREKTSGHDGGYMDDVTVHFERDGERWLIREVMPAVPWRGGDGKLPDFKIP